MRALTAVLVDRYQMAVGMKLFGKKSNEVWYKGTLVDIKSGTTPSVKMRIFILWYHFLLKPCCS